MKIEITKENYDRAIKSNSGSCLIADAIKEQHPQYSRISVDVGTIRMTDKTKGERYFWVSTPTVVETLLAFDQGYYEKSLPKTIILRQPIHIMPIVRSQSDLRSRAERNVARRTELEAKKESGQPLTRDEKRSLTVLQNPKAQKPRPKTYGPATFERVKDGDQVVVRGRPPSKLTRSPNLLHGKDRHFGAKMAEPGMVWEEALKERETEAARAAVEEYKASLKRKRQAKKA